MAGKTTDLYIIKGSNRHDGDVGRCIAAMLFTALGP